MSERRNALQEQQNSALNVQSDSPLQRSPFDSANSEWMRSTSSLSGGYDDPYVGSNQPSSTISQDASWLGQGAVTVNPVQPATDAPSQQGQMYGAIDSSTHRSVIANQITGAVADERPAGLFDSIGDAFNKAKNSAASVINRGKEAVTSGVKNVAGTVVKGVSKTDDVIEKGIGTIQEKTINAASKAVDTIGKTDDVIRKSIDSIEEKVTNTVSKAVDTIGKTDDVIRKGIDTIQEKTGNVVSKAVDTIGKTDDGVKDKIGSAIEKGIDTIKDGFGDLGKVVREGSKIGMLPEALDGLNGVDDVIQKGIGSAIEKGIDTFKDGFGNLSGIVQKASPIGMLPEVLSGLAQGDDVIQRQLDNAIDKGKDLLEDGLGDIGEIAREGSKVAGDAFRSADSWLKSHGTSLSEVGHTALDVAGLVPVLGIPADVANGAWYLSEGKTAEGVMSFVGVIPGLGELSTAGKLAARGSRFLPEGLVAKGADKLDDLAVNGGRALEVIGLPDNVTGAVQGFTEGVTQLAQGNPVQAGLAFTNGGLSLLGLRDGAGAVRGGSRQPDTGTTDGGFQLPPVQTGRPSPNPGVVPPGVGQLGTRPTPPSPGGTAPQPSIAPTPNAIPPVTRSDTFAPPTPMNPTSNTPIIGNSTVNDSGIFNSPLGNSTVNDPGIFNSPIGNPTIYDPGIFRGSIGNSIVVDPRMSNGVSSPIAQPISPRITPVGSDGAFLDPRMLNGGRFPMAQPISPGITRIGGDGASLDPRMLNRGGLLNSQPITPDGTWIGGNDGTWVDSEVSNGDQWVEYAAGSPALAGSHPRREPVATVARAQIGSPDGGGLFNGGGSNPQQENRPSSDPFGSPSRSENLPSPRGTGNIRNDRTPPSLQTGGGGRRGGGNGGGNIPPIPPDRSASGNPLGDDNGDGNGDGNGGGDASNNNMSAAVRRYLASPEYAAHRRALKAANRSALRADAPGLENRGFRSTRERHDLTKEDGASTENGESQKARREAREELGRSLDRNLAASLQRGEITQQQYQELRSEFFKDTSGKPKYELRSDRVAGHIKSELGRGRPMFAIEKGELNSRDGAQERDGRIFEKAAVELFGVPVNRQYAGELFRKGLIPRSVFAEARSHPGWTRHVRVTQGGVDKIREHHLQEELQSASPEKKARIEQTMQQLDAAKRRSGQDRDEVQIRDLRDALDREITNSDYQRQIGEMGELARREESEHLLSRHHQQLITKINAGTLERGDLMSDESQRLIRRATAKGAFIRRPIGGSLTDPNNSQLLGALRRLRVPDRSRQQADVYGQYVQSLRDIVRSRK